jgi:hypothetical protein
MIMLGVVGSVSPLPGLDVRRAVDRLARRQGLECDPSEFDSPYLSELAHMMDRRFELLSPSQCEELGRLGTPVVPLRMILKTKKDSVNKARLVLQGFREPREWDVSSNVSPVAHPSTIKSLIFMKGEEGDILSSIDVSVAFLQATEYGPDETPRYVSYDPYGDGSKYIFRLKGPIYGQRSAPRAWYKTITQWLVEEAGYVQGSNEPCVFLHPDTKHKIVLYVDDILSRGSEQVTIEFYNKLMARFDCKDPTYLTDGETITFTGLDLSMNIVEGYPRYQLSQERELREFLVDKGLEGERRRSSPMPDKTILYNDDEISEGWAAWCRSVIGGLLFFSRGVRWDISQAVSRVAQTLAKPNQGTVNQIKVIAGYLLNTMGDALSGGGCIECDTLTAMCDASHQGDRLTYRSQTGVIILLNGVPIHWRSNRQTKTALSPTESEIYALSKGFKDVRLMGWVLEECGVLVEWPIQLSGDSTGAFSFQGDKCPDSKIRGCFDYRDNWVSELQNAAEIRLVLVRDKENLADIFTKCHRAGEFVRRKELIAGGMRR